MNRPPTHTPLASGLSRNSTGLTSAHVALIRMLAAVAVEDYLCEIESDEAVQNNGEQHEDLA
jgi:hypothetical protein